MNTAAKNVVWAGVALTALYTLLIAGADAITKLFSAHFAAPQLFALSGGLVALFCVLASGGQGEFRGVLRTRCPKAMAVRTVATVIGTCAFFYAFKLLPFADVFLFIALIPILAAMMSPMILRERASGQVWGALCLGLVGMACVFPGGIQSAHAGHLVALLAVISGAVSMVASRYIGQRDPGRLLSQVFYPNLALMVVMGAALPFLFVPMNVTDMAWVLAYAVFLFGARWVLVAALKIMPAYVVTPLMNLQFVWMVAIGAIAFSERPAPGVFIGAALLILAGAWLVRDQIRVIGHKTAIPAE